MSWRKGASKTRERVFFSLSPSLLLIFHIAEAWCIRYLIKPQGQLDRLSSDSSSLSVGHAVVLPWEASRIRKPGLGGGVRDVLKKERYEERMYQSSKKRRVRDRGRNRTGVRWSKKKRRGTDEVQFTEGGN